MSGSLANIALWSSTGVPLWSSTGVPLWSSTGVPLWSLTGVPLWSVSAIRVETTAKRFCNLISFLCEMEAAMSLALSVKNANPPSPMGDVLENKTSK